MAILKRGVSGEPVRRLQAKLGVTADGSFGPATEAALKAYQTKNSLAADGIAGPDTFVQMGLYELVLLRKGGSGETVKKLQAALGLSADGKFGPGTEKAVMEFQTKNGLGADGVVGPATMSKLPAFQTTITPAVLGASRVSQETVESWHTATEKAAGSTAVTIEPPPPVKPAEIKAATADMGGTRSIWDTIKGIFK
jgi:peptidoglycan hydrolase-like protein with peptidoglycan-binding domain